NEPSVVTSPHVTYTNRSPRLPCTTGPRKSSPPSPSVTTRTSRSHEAPSASPATSPTGSARSCTPTWTFSYRSSADGLKLRPGRLCPTILIRMQDRCYHRPFPLSHFRGRRRRTSEEVEMDTDVFEDERPRLLGLAYRMLGSITDAEDVVQDAWLRWQGADR